MCREADTPAEKGGHDGNDGGRRHVPGGRGGAAGEVGGTDGGRVRQGGGSQVAAVSRYLFLLMRLYLLQSEVWYLRKVLEPIAQREDSRLDGSFYLPDCFDVEKGTEGGQSLEVPFRGGFDDNLAIVVKDP